MDDSNTPSTPDTELSPPCSPQQKIQHLRDTRSAAKEKLTQLTLEEKAWSFIFLSRHTLTFLGLTSHGRRLLEDKSYS